MKFIDNKVFVLPVLLSIVCFYLPACHNSGKNIQDDQVITVFHAGSLSVPLRIMAEEFEKQNPGVEVQLEATGSVACVRKITDLKRNCDVIALADCELIDRLLIPDHASWAIQLASNELCLAYTDKSTYSDEFTEKNWFEIISRDDVRLGRSNPDSDPCGYRSVLTLKLADVYYPNGVDLDKILSKDHRFIRPKETDLLALLETNTIDYMFIYSSVAVQHGLNFIKLPDSINLSNPDLGDFYSTATVKISGKTPGSELLMQGQAMIYGFTLPENSLHPDLGRKFAEFIVDTEKGLRIIEEAGQKVIELRLSPASISNPELCK